MTKPKYTEIGGQCPNCHADDKWIVLSKDLINRGGGYVDAVYDLLCDGNIVDDDSSEKCGCRKEILLDESPEYERPIE